MIVLSEGDSQASPKTPLLSSVNGASSSIRELPPPPYDGPSRHGVVALIHDSNNASTEPVVWRFTKALAVAIAVCLLFSAFTESLVEVTHRSKNTGRKDKGDWDVPDLPYPSPDEGQISKCLHGEAWQRDGKKPNTDPTLPDFAYQNSAGFDRGLSNLDRFFILTRGSKSTGRIILMEKPATTDENFVHVMLRAKTPGEITMNKPSVEADSYLSITARVTVRYNNDEILAETNLCQLDRSDTDQGIGVFSRNSWKPRWRNDTMHWTIELYFPQIPILLPNFYTHAPMFSHEIQNIEKRVQFEKFEIHAGSKPINISGISATNVSITTSNDKIIGTFLQTTFVDLQTTNGDVQAHVDLAGKDSEQPKLTIRTSNGLISTRLTAGVNIYAPNLPPFRRGGNYSATLQTSNGRITLAVPQTPVDSALSINVTTVNAPIDIILPPTYEGGFKLRTTKEVPIVHNNNTKIRDPSGRARTRYLSILEDQHGVVSGSVGWQSRGGPPTVEFPGMVSARTSNGKLKLNL